MFVASVVLLRIELLPNTYAPVPVLAIVADWRFELPPSVKLPAPANVTVPPFRLSASEFATVTAPPPDASEFGVTTRLSAPLVEAMPALMAMLLCADNESVAAAPVVLLMAAAMVMSPACALVPAELVVMLTLVPLLSAARTEATVTIAPSLVLVKFGPWLTLVSEPLA